jgi:2-keto-3-deoxy-L-rhamnonate aldolase RhmA
MFTSPKRRNPALDKIAAGGVANVYVTGNFASPRHVDFVCRSGTFDALWFDLEHFDIPIQELAVLNMVARAYPVSTVARIRASDYQIVMRTLEVAVDGLMCAMVNDADEARQIVRWAKFNNPTASASGPSGHRGWNGGNIDASYGNIPASDYIQQQNADSFILCQIETEEAVANAAEIAAVPGVNGLFFGPGDYSTSLGLAAQISHPLVHEALVAVARAAQVAGKWWGTIAVGHEMQTRIREMGGQFLCPGGDVKVMNLGLRELWKTIPQEAPPASQTEGNSSSTY